SLDIGHNDRITARLARLNVVDRQGHVGATGKVYPVEPPLIIERSGSTRCDSKCCVRSSHYRLALRLCRNRQWRYENERGPLTHGCANAVAYDNAVRPSFLGCTLAMVSVALVS